MKLYLVRHATAAEHADTDAERPLIGEGRNESKALAKAFRRLGAKPDVFVSSPLVRARQTAEIIAAEFDVKEKIQLTNALAPGGGIDDLYKFLAEFKKADEIALFGHAPDITTLVRRLLHAGEELDIPFKKAGACRIDVADLPPTTSGCIKWFITPKIAAEIARH